MNIKPIKSFDDLFALTKGNVLETDDGRFVGVYCAPKKEDNYQEWNFIEIKKPHIISHQIRGYEITIEDDGKIKFLISRYASAYYIKNGGPLHKCYQEFENFLTKAGIMEATQ